MDLPITHNRNLDDRLCMAANAFAVLAIAATIAAWAMPRDDFMWLYAHSSLIFPALPMAASVRALRGTDGDASRRGWGWVLAGITGFFIYDVIWYAGWLRGAVTQTVASEALTLVFPPLVLIGLLRHTGFSGSTTERHRQYLDSAIVTLGAAAVVHATMMLFGGGVRPVHDAQDLLLVLAPLFDLMTLGGLGVLWIRRGAGGVPVWTGGISAALLFGLVADVWYAVPASLTRDAPWFVAGAWYGSWAAIGIGATRAARARAIPPQPGRISRLPYVLAVICYAALAIAVAIDDRQAIVSTCVGAGVVTLLVLLRQLAAVRDVTAMESGRAQALSDQRLASLVQHSSDMLTIISEDMLVQYASPSHELVFGIEPERLVGRPALGGIHAEDQLRAGSSLQRLVAGTTQRESLVCGCAMRAATGAGSRRSARNLLGHPAIGGPGRSTVATSRTASARGRAGRAGAARSADRPWQSPAVQRPRRARAGTAAPVRGIGGGAACSTSITSSS